MHTELSAYQNSVMYKLGVTCADCHMDKKVAEDGTAYTNHVMQSPLKSETLITDNGPPAPCAGVGGLFLDNIVLPRFIYLLVL